MKANLCSSSILICGLYYYIWVYAIPSLKGCKVRQETVDLGNGAVAHQLIRIPKDKVAEWDRYHDAVGRHISEVDVKSSAVEETKLSA